MTTNYCDYEYEVLSTHKENNVVTEGNNKWRVKLYHLNEEGQWDDKGTGHVFINNQVNC